MNDKANTITVSDIALAMAVGNAGVGARNHRLKIEMAKWLISETKKMQNPWSVVLTYRFPIADDTPTEKQLGIMERAMRKHFTSFVRSLSENAFGRTICRRHEKSIKAYGLFERGENDRFHIHAIFDVPKHADIAKSYDTRFKKDVQVFWAKHGKATEVTAVVGDNEKAQCKSEALKALCLYIVKLRTKYTQSGSYTDALLFVE